MGPSVGFVRGWLALWALVGTVGLLLGATNELLDLGLFTGGYPVVGGSGDFAAFALQVTVAVIALLALSTLLGWFER